MLFLGEHKYITDYNAKRVKFFQMTDESWFCEITLEYEIIVYEQ